MTFLANLTTAVIFLLREFIEAVGTNYAHFIPYLAQEKDDVLRRVLQQEKERYEAKLGKARWFLERLETGKK